MKHLSASQRDNIISLASLDLSCQEIASQIGLGTSTVARVLQEIHPERENHLGDHSSKLLPTYVQMCYCPTNPYWEGQQCSSGNPFHQFHHPHPYLLTNSEKHPKRGFPKGCSEEEKAPSLCYP